MFPLRAYRYNSSLRAKQTCSIASAAQTRADFPLWELSITQFTTGPTCLSSKKLGDREEQAAAVGYGGKRMSWAEPADQTLVQQRLSVNPARPLQCRLFRERSRLTQKQGTEAEKEEQLARGPHSPAVPEHTRLWEQNIHMSHLNGGCPASPATAPAQDWWLLLLSWVFSAITGN